MDVTFTGPVWYWRGPAPYYFVTVPAEASQRLKAVAGLVSYGWGVIPVSAQVGQTRWSTSLIPKDGLYLLPLKDSVRAAERLNLEDVIAVQLSVRPPATPKKPPHRLR